jgi:integrase
LVREVAQHCGWSKLVHIDAEGVSRYARHLQVSRGMASRTVASMVTAVRSFCRWCVLHGYLAADPTATNKKPSAKVDRRIERRMLLPEEWQTLRAWLESHEVFRNGMTSAGRSLMYRTAIETGLRSSELRSLTRSALQLDGDEPHVLVRAGITKNGQQARQFISDSLAADLRKHVARKAPGAEVFEVASRSEMARTLRADIRDARAEWLKTVDDEQAEGGDFLRSPDSQGQVLDFHALRHTCGAWLVQQGVTLAETKEIMRHSTISLTVDTYGHLAPDAKSGRRQVLGGLL